MSKKLCSNCSPRCANGAFAIRSVTSCSEPLGSLNVPDNAASAWSRELSALGDGEWRTVSICEAVWPAAPARAIDSASRMLAGETTALSPEVRPAL